MEFKITMETNFWACLWGSFSIRPIEADWFTPAVGGITPWCPGKDWIKTGSSEPSTSALALLALSFLTVDEVWAATSSSVRTSNARGPSSQTERGKETLPLSNCLLSDIWWQNQGGEEQVPTVRVILILEEKWPSGTPNGEGGTLEETERILVFVCLRKYREKMSELQHWKDGVWG